MICKTTVCREILGPSGDISQSHPLLMYVSGAICVLLFLYILKRIFWLVFGTKGTVSFFVNVLKIAVPLCVFFVSLSVFMTQRVNSNPEARFSFLKDVGIRNGEIAVAKAQEDMSFYEKSGVVASHTLLDILNANFVKRNGGTIVLQVNNDPNAKEPSLSDNSTLTFTSAAGKSVTVPVKIFGIQKHNLHPGYGVFSHSVLAPNLVKNQTITNPSIVMTGVDGGYFGRGIEDGVYKRIGGVDLTAYYGDFYKIWDTMTNDHISIQITAKNLSDLAQVFDNPSDPKIVMR